MFEERERWTDKLLENIRGHVLPSTVIVRNRPTNI